MSQIITISSINYSGEVANILFKPDNESVVINLGNVSLPYLFDAGFLTPPREPYGTYTIYTLADKCTNFLNVPRPTPTPTPTRTPTRTPTPTSTPTCFYYNVTISTIDTNDATGNTPPLLDNAVYVGYTDCNNVGQIMTLDEGTYNNAFCTEFGNPITLTYYKNNVANQATFSTVMKGNTCSI